jgi:membrane-bound inhibitor of C-type lysozyme
MIRFALSAAASLLLAAAAHAETKPADRPAAPPKAEKPAKPDAKAAAARKRVTYACDGGVAVTVTYPPEAQAKTGRVKIAFKETTYFVRPVAGGEKWENKSIKLVFQPKGEEASIEREGKPLAEKCRAAKSGT